MKSETVYKNIFVLLFFLMLSGAVFSVSDGATIQVSSYSSTPATLYPGTTGQLQLTLSNGGSATATGVTIYHDNGITSDAYDRTTIGDIGASSSTIASIPFSVPSSVPSGIIQLYLRIYYNYDSSTGSKTGSLTTTIALPVSQRQIVEVKTVSINGTTVTPGDRFTVDLKLINTGGVVKNAVIQSPDNSSFTIDGASQQTVGDISFNSSKTVSVDLRSSSSSSPGKYTIPLTIEYQDALQNTISQKVYIGPVSVADSSAQFDVSLKPLSGTEVGSQAQFELSVLNRGATPSSLIIDFNQSSVFTPMGNGRVYIDDIKPGETITRNVIIGISSTASGGYYSLPVEILSPGKSYIQDIGVEVLATEEITTSIKTDMNTITSGSSVTVSAQIANTGNTPIRSVYVSAQPTKEISVIGTSDKFIGTLNVDDFTTFQFVIGISGRAQVGNYTVPIKITFKDSTNTPHEVYKNIIIAVSGGAGTSPNGSFASAASPSITGTSFAGRKQNGTLGFGLLGDVAGGIALIIIAYFAYKKFWLKRKESKKENEKAKGIN